MFKVQMTWKDDLEEGIYRTEIFLRDGREVIWLKVF